MLKTCMNYEYSFERYVVGQCNKFAVAAAMAVAESLGDAYNPLIICGNNGTGKTHLMNAIGLFVKESNPNANIVYMTADELTKGVIESFRNEHEDESYNIYDSMDVLLIDGIHYIAGKEATQEEFFRIFNRMQLSHKQIVMTSDIEPRKMRDLEERIYARFAMGITAEIDKLDEEVKAGILNQYLEKQDFVLPSSVKEMIIEIGVNAFDMQGFVKKLHLSKELDNLLDRDITVDWAKGVLEMGTDTD